MVELPKTLDVAIGDVVNLARGSRGRVLSVAGSASKKQLIIRPLSFRVKIERAEESMAIATRQSRAERYDTIPLLWCRRRRGSIVISPDGCTRHQQRYPRRGY